MCCTCGCPGGPCGLACTRWSRSNRESRPRGTRDGAMAEELAFETEFNAVLDAEPFVPFTIVLANGDRHHVYRRRIVSTGLDVVIIAYPSVTVTIRYFNIVSFEVHESSRR